MDLAANGTISVGRRQFARDGQFANGNRSPANAIAAEKTNDDYSAAHAEVQTPDWAKHAVWYQIFPERFRNGDPSNDPGDNDTSTLVHWQANWWKASQGEAPGDENFYKGQGNVWKRRYGGDMQGLIEALPYLESLGITAIYLNPMFEADSMHKYDTTDYRHIDDNFGIKGDVAAAGRPRPTIPATWTVDANPTSSSSTSSPKPTRQGFKVILDGVFNHVGRSHWAFRMC